jgi:hypothetical protein
MSGSPKVTTRSPAFTTVSRLGFGSSSPPARRISSAIAEPHTRSTVWPTNFESYATSNSAIRSAAAPLRAISKKSTTSGRSAISAIRRPLVAYGETTRSAPAR